MKPWRSINLDLAEEEISRDDLVPEADTVQAGKVSDGNTVSGRLSPNKDVLETKRC